ncbi:hypothetical protein A3C89_03325 [Candidatus Kaiserbacteria bacterium RIFCSPHIGHO2_02_FULL_50_50]|uniref:NodB homology domain-containing protein n=1 Tax=Candidatus Kaiserbacteria bacterium RIFCSPHIGHO2_02_FULL_50_50 TaxID=1798492 RepID=A0A1F6DEU6_9BACT|nr:MAG: hypothetical protein A3C89_03325 [Candidatus Kaiserbacteria bacterium RIFCSPHIGHO2_02_FULL_50_50]OGG89240.1 MAG: hypothetical protein A3G62_01295 [Candidatus Kaiserbacteria bacterium RIFCSPLOWO2_12_FULL_50_10]
MKTIRYRIVVLCLCFFGNAFALPDDFHKYSRMVSFTFDDAYKSVATHAYPLFRKHGIHATVYLATATMSNPELFPGYFSWDDAKEVDVHGWEIGAHTHMHVNLAKSPEEAAAQEISASMQLFRERGFRPTSFAAPYGAMHEKSMRLIKQNYASQRDAWGGDGVNPLPVQDPYRIVSLPLKATMTMADIRAVLDRLEKDGGWLVLQFHDVGSVNTGPWSTTLLPEIVAEVRRRKLPVATVSEVLKHHSSTH